MLYHWCVRRETQIGHINRGMILSTRGSSEPFGGWKFGEGDLTYPIFNFLYGFRPLCFEITDC